MHLSSFLAKAALSVGMAVAWPVSGLADGDLFVTNGGQYSISGAMPGAQVMARLGINSGGGFMVFEDNLDGSGEGIGALALDSNFNPVGSRFRVNQIRYGDQELPQVALLSGGGTFFVWQSRPLASSRHIFGRWLSSSNTWLTGDTMINTFTHDSQTDPVVCALNNGNVVVAYGSRNQAGAGSMQDVYAQIFNATGGVVTAEFLVNQTTVNNQRTPAMALLSDGRFVIAWVSENPLGQQAGAGINPDIYARLFAANGAAVGNEFKVNTAVNPAANPSAAAGANGSFVIGWSQLAPTPVGNLTLTNGGLSTVGMGTDFAGLANSWEVFARAFTSAGDPAAAPFQLNTYTRDDQSVPKIASLATGYLALWTSMGQDGSAEGVYGRFLDATGGVASAEFRVNTTTLRGQKYPTISSDGNARFLTVWSSYNAFPYGEDLYAQRYATPDFISSAPVTNYFAPANDPFPTDVLPVEGGTNGPGFVGGLVLNQPPVETNTGLVSYVKGTFYGILSDETNGMSASSSGLFTVTTTTRGVFTVKLIQGGKTYSGSGRFNANGQASLRMLRGSLRSLGVSLQLDPSGVQITGSASDTHWTSSVVAFRSTYDRKSNPATDMAGVYTVQIPGDAQSTNGPAGAGVASLKIDLGGKVIWSGSLADGSKVSQASVLFDSGYWPMYSSLYGGSGCVASWLQVSNNGVSGQCVWLKPARMLSKYYTGGSSTSGFTNVVEATGSLYSPPRKGQFALDWGGNSGSLVLGGNERASGSYTVRLNNNRIVGMAAKLSLTITPGTGLFKGVFTPSSGEKVQVLGAILQDSQSGVGYFLGAQQSGAVTLEGQP